MLFSTDNFRINLRLKRWHKMANNLDHAKALQKIIQGLNEQDNNQAQDVQFDDEQIIKVDTDTY